MSVSFKGNNWLFKDLQKGYPMTTYKLYYAPGACSLAVHALLNELKLPYTTQKIDTKAPRTPEFLKINPRGAVPVLEIDGKILREGAAIIITLLETNKSPLLPSEGFERAKALEWLSFANSTLHPAYGRGFGLGYLPVDDKTKDTILNTKIVPQIQKYWDEVETQVKKEGGYLAGKQPTAADFLVTVIANWTPMLFGDKIKFGPGTQNLLRSISARPSYQKALSDEGVQYKAVA
jgi:glutathione S-transferase